jgi:transposase
LLHRNGGISVQIERLRKEGSKLLQRERENIEREVHKQPHTATHTHHQQHAHSSQHAAAPHTHCRLRIRWTPTDDVGYDNDSLTRLFKKVRCAHFRFPFTRARVAVRGCK